MDSQKPAVEWCLFSGNHGNRCLVQMDITNQVPVLTASYLSLRISVNVQCQNEFHLGHFLNRSKWKDWKKKENKQCEEKRQRRECGSEGEGDGNLLCLLGYMIRHICWEWHYSEERSLGMLCSALFCSVLLLYYIFFLFFSGLRELIKWNTMFFIIPHKGLHGIPHLLFYAMAKERA